MPRRLFNHNLDYEIPEQPCTEEEHLPDVANCQNPIHPVCSNSEQNIPIQYYYDNILAEIENPFLESGQEEPSENIP